MTGAANRRRGHAAERAVVRWLRDHGYPDAYTTRSRLGHDGAHAPGDVVGPVGLVIEVKHRAASSWPAWCEQANIEAQGRPWVVVRKLAGCTDVARWPSLASKRWPRLTIDPERHGLIEPFGDFLAWFDEVAA